MDGHRAYGCSTAHLAIRVRTMSPAELRRLYRAACAVDALPARVEALQARYDHAEVILRAALTDGPLVLPGYRATLADGRATVARSAITNAAQLALWRMMSATAQED
jgi:hypothetical protein